MKGKISGEVWEVRGGWWRLLACGTTSSTLPQPPPTSFNRLDSRPTIDVSWRFAAYCSHVKQVAKTPARLATARPNGSCFLGGRRRGDEGRVSEVTLRKLLDDGKVHVLDGAMGTMLYSKGFFLDVCYDELNLKQPKLVQEVHEAYVRAGAEILETNTFGANPVKLG